MELSDHGRAGFDHHGNRKVGCGGKRDNAPIPAPFAFAVDAVNAVFYYFCDINTD